MAVNLSIKNVPEPLADLLRRRAAANRRSLQRELLSILEGAVGLGPIVPDAAGSPAARHAITIEELAAVSRQLFPTGSESSVEYIRQMRDSR